VISFKLILDSNTKYYKPEIMYVLSYIQRCYDVCYLSEGTPDVILSYGNVPDTRASFHISSELIQQVLQLDVDGLKLISKKKVMDALSLWSDNGLALPVVSGINYVECKLDLFVIAFVILSRIEERGSNSEYLDSHGRYSINRDIVFQVGLYGKPIVDILIDSFIQEAFDGKAVRSVNYSTVLTHDVDRLRSYHSIWSSLKAVSGDIVKRVDMKLAYTRMCRELNLFEPWASALKLVNIYDKLGISALFFLMGRSSHPMDSGYAISMPRLLKRYVEYIQHNGHKIGLHPGYTSFTDESVYNRQKEGLERELGLNIVSARQHVLRFSIDKTPLIAEKCGVKEDYTLAYPEMLGFRNGTSRGMYAYDFCSRQLINILLYSTSIVDFTIHDGKYVRLSQQSVDAEVREIVGHCKKHEGCLVALYHSGYMINENIKFYQNVLSLI